MAQDDRRGHAWYTRGSSEDRDAVHDVDGQPAGREDREDHSKPLGSTDLLLPAGHGLPGGGGGVGIGRGG